MLFTALTVLLLVALALWGIPALVKLAIFLGELKSSSQPLTGEDTLPPSPPVILPLMEATNSAFILVEGFAEEGATVALFLDGVQRQETVVGSDGDFLFSQVSLKEGQNRIEAFATDQSGNRSQPSMAYTVVLDTTLPTLSVEEPQEGRHFVGSWEQRVRISGSASSETTVEVNGSLVIIAHDGSFATSVQLNEGTNLLSVVARDRAGNQTIVTRTVTFEP